MSIYRTVLCILLIILGVCGASYEAAAQSTGTIAGRVMDAETGEPLAGANVAVESTGRGAAARQGGSFVISGVPVGTYTLQARFVGYEPQSEEITVPADDTVRVRFTLAPHSVTLQGIEVSALRPDLQPQAQLEETEIREANPRDSGELLRNLPGVDAVRRGPVGLDPVVRGLRETEVGTYLDGTRIFPGGAARMDSPLSHLDPSAIQSIEVVKGPYALTWGAGNMSAIRVETRGLWSSQEPFQTYLTSGYDSNFNSFESAASVSGVQGAAAYRLHGAWREGNDYRTGAGGAIPADFLSREVRGKLGYRLPSEAQVKLSAGYQNQQNIDYPGRLLNADFFNTYNLSVAWEQSSSEGLLRSTEALAYVNRVDHGMDNEDKPTARPMEGRMPPFGLRVNVDSHVNVTGGRLAADLAPGSTLRAEVGGDVYRAHRNALRRIERRDTGKLLFEDLMWPEATTTDLGLFTKLERSLSPLLHATGTVRLDLVRSKADTASTFFRNNVSTDLSSEEANLSGAATLQVTPGDHWALSLGAGSVVRTADATERYSDRIPASKAQTSAEFVGNPDLAPERSTQADVWIEGSYPRWALSVNAFARRMDDYITLAPTNLPRRLPLSPETVFRYVNGTATFYGGEASLSYRLLSGLHAQLAARYLRGQDETLEEPALGVAPPRLKTGLRYESSGHPFFVQGTAHLVSDQERVAARRGEKPSEGYVTVDLRGGVELRGNVSLQVGVTNLLDVDYTNHLNAKNPFTGQQIPEPGRVFFADLVATF